MLSALYKESVRTAL